VFWLYLYDHLFRSGPLRQCDLHVNVFYRLTPVVLFRFSAIICTDFLINFHFWLTWSWNFILLRRIILRLLHTFCLLRNFYNLWLVFWLLNFYNFGFSLFFFCQLSFQFSFFSIFLKLLPSFCKRFSFWRKLFLVLILVLFVKLIYLEISVSLFMSYLQDLRQILVGIPFCHLVLLRSRNRCAFAKKKTQSLANRGCHRPLIR
jgi:hypothetical protein